MPKPIILNVGTTRCVNCSKETETHECADDEMICAVCEILK